MKMILLYQNTFVRYFEHNTHFCCKASLVQRENSGPITLKILKFSTNQRRERVIQKRLSHVLLRFTFKRLRRYEQENSAYISLKNLLLYSLNLGKRHRQKLIMAAIRRLGAVSFPISKSIELCSMCGVS